MVKWWIKELLFIIGVGIYIAEKTEVMNKLKYKIKTVLKDLLQ